MARNGDRARIRGDRAIFDSRHSYKGLGDRWISDRWTEESTYGSDAPAEPTSYVRALTVDHTKVPSTQTDFPVLFSVTDTTLKIISEGGHVRANDGSDIGFFSDAAGTTLLKWEIERYIPTTGELIAWIKIPSLSSSSDTVFYLRYGLRGVTDQSDPVNTWSNNFLGVYHLGVIGGLALNVSDSTGTNNGTDHSCGSGTGYIGYGGGFQSTTPSYITLGNGINPTALTYSAWVKATSFPGTYNAVVSRHNGTQFSLLRIKSNSKLNANVYRATLGGSGYDGSGALSLSTATWYHLAMTYSAAAGGVAYVNTAVDATFTSGGEGLNTTAANIRIGSDPFTAGRDWNGLIDEVHIASVARTADWITAEYNNQSSPGTFITMGTETGV